MQSQSQMAGNMDAGQVGGQGAGGSVNSQNVNVSQGNSSMGNVPVNNVANVHNAQWNHQTGMVPNHGNLHMGNMGQLTHMGNFQGGNPNMNMGNPNFNNLAAQGNVVQQQSTMGHSPKCPTAEFDGTFPKCCPTTGKQSEYAGSGSEYRSGK